MRAKNGALPFITDLSQDWAVKTTKPKAKKATRQAPVETVEFRDIRLPIYRRKAGKYENFVFSYYSAGKRVQKCLGNLETAVGAAKEIARQLSEGTGRTVALEAQQVADYLTAARELRPLGLTVSQAAVRLAEAMRHIPAGGSLVEAAKRYARDQKKEKLPACLMTEAVRLFVESKQKKNRSSRYVDDMERRGEKVADAFRCGIAGIGVGELEAFLDRVKGTTNRAAYREFLVGLFRFAQRRGFLPRDARTEAEQLETVERKSGAIEIYSPAELHSAMEAAQGKERLAVALAAFTGIRSAELRRLYWEDINGSNVTVAAEKAKTAQRRLVPILPALAAVLADFERGEGPIFPHSNDTHFSRFLNRAVRRAGIKPKTNAFRHSFASYRLAEVKSAEAVALEMGNSPRKLFTNYRELVTAEDAALWFSVRPQQDGEKVVAFAAA
jgi:integrase